MSQCNLAGVFISPITAMRRVQIEQCYPQFEDFLKLKLKYDPDERFSSDWYLHYRDVSAGKRRGR